MLLLDCAGLVQESRRFDGMLTSSEYNIKNRVAFQGRHKYVEVYDGGGGESFKGWKGRTYGIELYESSDTFGPGIARASIHVLRGECANEGGTI